MLHAWYPKLQWPTADLSLLHSILFLLLPICISGGAESNWPLSLTPSVRPRPDVRVGHDGLLICVLCIFLGPPSDRLAYAVYVILLCIPNIFADPLSRVPTYANFLEGEEEGGKGEPEKRLHVT